MITPEKVIEHLENRCKKAEQEKIYKVGLLQTELRILLDELERRKTEAICLSIQT